MVRAGGVRLIGLLLVSQFIIAFVAFPVFRWLFREALRAGGMHGLDLGALATATALPATFLLLGVLVLLAFWLISLQFTAIVVLLRWPGLSWRACFAELGRVARQLARPSSLPLVAYLFVLLPLSGFGFTSSLAQGVAIPSFISGELLKTTSSTIALTLFLLLLAWLNLRLSLTVPIFVLSNGRRAARSSWRLTRGLRSSVSLVLAVATVTLAAGVAGLVLFVTAIVPTAITDATAPAASPYLAAYSLGIAQVVGALLVGLTTAWVAGILLARVAHGASQLRPQIELVPDPAPTPVTNRSRSPRRVTVAIVTTVAVLGAGLGTASIDTLHRLAKTPESLVLAHRGFSEGGVENTISGLEAAATAGADLVEMDVMETKDGQFVAMHDATLGRLAGREVAVKDLTLAEITQIEVHDQYGNTDRVPSFADYVRRANELDMPLLVEIKLGGADSPDHVERLVAELEQLGLLERNIYHSLDAESVATLKHLRPNLSVGYTMAFAGGGVPTTPADFIVVEQWTATERMQNDARDAGLGFFAWTVNDEPGIREHLRRGTDGIITDYPDTAVAARTEMGQERGLTDVLLDALTRFVTVV